ncbi:hypothetical protein ACIRL2_41375 [Embleya sp. NPDC127516]|uniref:hypothetical protein n=1 Tax=Embleya sp. NPDC127516 TaxID=3363990 RepID=UPI00381EF11E
MHGGDYSTLFAVFRGTGVINREGFYLPTYDPETGACNGRIDAHAFAHEILNALGRCGEEEGTCPLPSCAPENDDEPERVA